MSSELIATLCTLIGVGIGIAGYLSGLQSRAKQDGRLIEKVEQVERIVTEIKSEMNNKNGKYDEVISEHTAKITEHDQQIKTLFRDVKELKEH